MTNDRGAARGGRTERVGTIYSSWRGRKGPGPAVYSGRPINATSSETVTETVRAATADALAHAGVSNRPGGAKLTASVRDYWVDGHEMKSAIIIVRYELTDASDRVLWHAEVWGQASGLMTVGNGLPRIVRAALQDFAQHSCNAFREPDFRTAVRGAS